MCRFVLRVVGRRPAFILSLVLSPLSGECRHGEPDSCAIKKYRDRHFTTILVVDLCLYAERGTLVVGSGSVGNDENRQFRHYPKVRRLGSGSFSVV